jgi:hypothetical protein
LQNPYGEKTAPLGPAGQRARIMPVRLVGARFFVRPKASFWVLVSNKYWMTGDSEVTRSISEAGALFRISVANRDYYHNIILR